MTQTITVDEVARDVLVIRGVTLESTATAFLAGDETVLVDALASVDESLAMRPHLEEERGAQVATIVAMHYMDDHVAGIAAVPEARVLARLEAANRSHVVASHLGIFAASAIDAAGRKLQTLAHHVRAGHARGSGWRERVLAVDMHDCLPRGLQVTLFERYWHGQNLQRIAERQLFRVSYA